MKRILVAEDEEAIANILFLNLQAVDYEPVIFYDGLSVQKALQEDDNYDVALLDIMLPGLDGFELLSLMNEHDIPAVFLTAMDDVESKVKGLKGGAEDYIVKPFEILEVLVRIEKVLERRNRVENKVTLKDLEIDFKERTVKKYGEEIHLKPMEFNLLETLIKNKNIAISREKLLDMVWGYDYFGEIHTVDVHIGQLRKKLDLKDVIKTVSRYGYRLEEGE